MFIFYSETLPFWYSGIWFLANTTSVVYNHYIFEDVKLAGQDIVHLKIEAVAQGQPGLH